MIKQFSFLILIGGLTAMFLSSQISHSLEKEMKVEKTKSQNMELMSVPFAIIVPKGGIGGPEYDQEGNDVLVASTGVFSGTKKNREIKKDKNGIITYIVQKGDTLSEIAENFGISVNTIKWENKLKGSQLKIGQELKILPVTGVSHIIKKGDTLAKLAKRYQVNIEDISIYNGIQNNAGLRIGEKIIIPNGVISSPITKTKTKTYVRSKRSVGGNAQKGYYIRPAQGRISSWFGPRRLKGHSYHFGIDFANRIGTPIVAAHDGVVVKVVNYCTNNSGRSRCGGGYGNHIKIQHPNGTFTLYGHAKRILVAQGTKVKQGQKIAIMGNTGRSTGPHVHFEIIKANGQKVNPNNLFR